MIMAPKFCAVMVANANCLTLIPLSDRLHLHAMFDYSKKEISHYSRIHHYEEYSNSKFQDCFLNEPSSSRNRISPLYARLKSKIQGGCHSSVFIVLGFTTL